MNILDKDGNDKINFKEFTNIFGDSINMNDLIRNAKLQIVFNRIDLNMND